MSSRGKVHLLFVIPYLTVSFKRPSETVQQHEVENPKFYFLKFAPDRKTARYKLQPTVPF